MRYPFTLEARARLRAIDRSTALRILEAIARYGDTGTGDIEPLHGEWKGCFRLRVGEYRVVFRRIPGGLEILTIGHRSGIYE